LVAVNPINAHALDSAPMMAIALFTARASPFWLLVYAANSSLPLRLLAPCIAGSLRARALFSGALSPASVSTSLHTHGEKNES
jgi:hypothetical protein